MPNDAATGRQDWHALTAEETLAALKTCVEGLSPEEAASRLKTDGPNALPKEKEPSRLRVFLKQFNSALVYVLLAAAAISWFTGHGFDAAAILFVILLNGVVGYAQERKAERAIAKLRELTTPTVAVRRGGQATRIPAADLVVGDVVLMIEGGRVPADLRLIVAKEARADESALTGESVPVAKDVEPVAATSSLGDRTDLLYMGTLLSSGEAEGVVVGTGTRTEFGKITGALLSIGQERTPFERRLDRLAIALGVIAVASAGLIFVVGLYRDLPLLDIFLFAVAAAVSSIPEGLPLVLVVVLSVGVQRMARRNAVIRHLPAVETLGVVDVICSDKTGTLTENKMTVREVAMLDGSVHVTGEGWSSEGEFLTEAGSVDPAGRPDLNRILRVAALCARGDVELVGGAMVAIGDPTEAALTVFARKGGFDRKHVLRTERALDEIPFGSAHRYRAVLHASAGTDGPEREIMVVGALEAIIERASKAFSGAVEGALTPLMRKSIEEMNERLAGQAMRVIAVAVREADAGAEDLGHGDIRDLTFLGLIGMIDPPRKGIREALDRCRAAGIRVLMATGDHKATALAISREIGLLPAGEGEDRVLTDAEVVGLSDQALRHKLRTVAVFARVSPQTKLRVVQQLRQLGHVVAVTGDGINDAPALKAADVGVAMGRTGSDVTKEVADMVLVDDDFQSVVSAVEEGRIVFRNTKQTTGFLIMTNAGEIITVLATLFLGLPLPLLPAQVLWLNLVTDALTDEALALEPRHGNELKHPPRSKDARIISRNLLILIALTSLLMAAGTVMLFRWAIKDDGLDHARSIAFLSMALFQLWNIFNMRSASASIFSLRFRTNPWVLGTVAFSLGLIALIMYVPFFYPIFRLQGLGWKEWALVALVSSSVFWLVEGYKILVRRGVIPRSWI